MGVAIRKATFDDLHAILYRSPMHTIQGADDVMSSCYLFSEGAWVGQINGDLACAWGLIPPTILSDTAYIWLITTPLVEEHKFIFTRHSQLIVEQILQRYSTVCGECLRDDVGAIRWVKWLGGKFEFPEGKKVRFVIRKE